MSLIVDSLINTLIPLLFMYLASQMPPPTTVPPPAKKNSDVFSTQNDVFSSQSITETSQTSQSILLQSDSPIRGEKEKKPDISSIRGEKEKSSYVDVPSPIRGENKSASPPSNTSEMHPFEVFKKNPNGQIPIISVCFIILQHVAVSHATNDDLGRSNLQLLSGRDDDPPTGKDGQFLKTSVCDEIALSAERAAQIEKKLALAKV